MLGQYGTREAALAAYAAAIKVLDYADAPTPIGNYAQQRLEWIAAAVHGDPVTGQGECDQVVRQIHALRKAAGYAVERLTKGP
jgi:hypothetical protein